MPEPSARSMRIAREAMRTAHTHKADPENRDRCLICRGDIREHLTVDETPEIRFARLLDAEREACREVAKRTGDQNPYDWVGEPADAQVAAYDMADKIADAIDALGREEG